MQPILGLEEGVSNLELQPNPCANQNWLACPFHMSAMSCQPLCTLIHLLIQHIFTGHFLHTGHSFRCWIYQGTLDLSQKAEKQWKYQSKQTKSMPSWSSHSLEGDSQRRLCEMLWVAV